MEAPETVTEAVRLLERDGYRGDFSVRAGTIHCGACEAAHEPGALVVRRTFRFEGETDPADEAIVLGVECPQCATKGVIVSAYGPDADSELLALVETLGR